MIEYDEYPGIRGVLGACIWRLGAERRRSLRTSSLTDPDSIVTMQIKAACTCSHLPIGPKHDALACNTVCL